MAPIGGVFGGTGTWARQWDPKMGEYVCLPLSTQSYKCDGTDTACRDDSSPDKYYTNIACNECKGASTYCHAGCCSSDPAYKDGPPPCIPTCSLPACPTGYSTTNQNCSTASCPDGWDIIQQTGDTVYSCRKRNRNSCDTAWCDYQYCYRNATNTSAPVAPDYAIMSTPLGSKNLSTSSSSRTIFDYRGGGSITVSSSTTPTDSTIVGYRYRLRLTPDGSDLEDTGDGTNITRSLTYSPFPTTGVILAQRYNWRCPDNTVIQRSDSTYGYFCMERNVKPPTTPTGMNMTIDGQVYHLSTDEPKVVKYPTTNATTTNTKLHVLPTRSTPSTASASGYRVEANNYGLGEWMDFSCLRGEDFCSEGTSNEHNFSPNTETLLNVLREGAEGKIDGKYYDVNECDATKVYSDPEDFYYKVNNNPDFGCPNIVNDEDDRTSTRGCVSTTHTGTEVNNPLKFEIIGSDQDGVEEIKGAIVWLSKNGTINEIPAFPTIAGTYTRSDPNHIAVMVLQRNGSWANSPLLYAPDSANGYNWGNITASRQISTTDGTMATINNVNVTVNGENVNFNIEVTLNEVTLGQIVYPEGNYNVSGLVFDEHMLLAGGTVVDQFYMSTDCRAGGWNIDLRRPIFESGSPTSETVFSRVLRLLWNFNGTGSYATDAVVNAYSYTATEEVILESPSGYPNMTLTTPAPEAEIGVMSDTNAWKIINSVASETYDSNARINIGENDDGTIIFYVTGFDQACNFVISDDPVTINLNPWLTSKGGFVYSGDNVGAHAKDYTAYSGFINSVLRKVTADELDIGTEVVTSRSGTINDFIHPELRAVRASGISNSNSQMSSWYEYFSNRLAEQMVVLGQSNFRLFGFPHDGILNNNRISDYCVTPFLPQAEREYCYMNIPGNLNVVPSYKKILPNGERRSELICDKKTLIMASGDIHIEPDIINGGETNIDGCLFVAGGSITVGAGDWVTQSATELEETKYDYLDAYLVADDIIDIQLVDLKEPGEAGSVIYTRDGLEIYGGLVAFGQNIPTGTSAVQANRSFGLWNAYIPTTTITWDPRYAKLAEAFFGSTAAMYKREVGFKPY